MIKAVDADITLDLRPLSKLLWSRGINHRINEQSGRQVIWVRDQGDAADVIALMQRYQRGDLDSMTDGPRQGASGSSAPGVADYFEIKTYLRDGIRAFMESPVTIGLIICSALVALISKLGTNTQPVSLLFYPALGFGGEFSVGAVLADISGLGDLIRTLTPMFLHFGVIHIVFNMLWLWFFGRQIEQAQPSLQLLGVVLFIAFVSNTTQYVSAISNNFGGMSGVVYGLLGYIWVWQLFFPRGRLGLTPAMFGFFVIALVLMEVFASSWIATAAHIGGLFSGMFAAAVLAGFQRLRRPNTF